jgi:hypothetical protein
MLISRALTIQEVARLGYGYNGLGHGVGYPNFLEAKQHPSALAARTSQDYT